MRQAVLASDEVAQVSELLREVGRRGHASLNVQANARYWADAMAERAMEPRDLQRIAWLLLQISDSRGLPVTHRRDAGYWAAYLRSHL
jgi:hypothetical protein